MNLASHRSFTQRLLAGIGAFGLSVMTLGSAQASVNIANAPLFVTSSVEPNIVFVIDDSGSMMWETIPDDLTYRFWNNNINSLLFWLFPPIHNLHGAEYYGTGNANWGRLPFFRLNDSGTPSNFAAHVRSANNNAIYYNPAVAYLPWSNPDGSLMPSAPPTAAPNRPGFPVHGTRNLTTEIVHNRWWRDNGTTINTNLTVFMPTYFQYDGVGDLELAASYEHVEIRPANGPFVGHGRENRSDCAGATSIPPVCTYEEEIQNFANWFTYYRNRIFASRAGIGRAFSGFDGGMRVGYGAIHHARTATTLPLLDGVGTRTVVRGVRSFTGADKNAFFATLYERAMVADGTPLRRALDGAGQYFSRTDSQGPWSSTPGVGGGVDLSCRQSFTILMTDGFATGGSGWDATHADRRANTDGSTAQNTTNINPAGPDFSYDPTDPFRDARGDTLADVAMYYWKRDLHPVINRVPTSDRNPAFWQHMVTYGIGLGVQGTVDPAIVWQALEDGTPVAWPDPAFGTANCGQVAGACSARIDDLLHAAVNSRGGFFSARDPDTFANELLLVLEDIVARVEATATAAATSSAVLQTDTLLYTAGFRSGDWSGRLDASNVNPDGSLGSLAWDAEQKLATTPPSARNIITRRGDLGIAVTFEYDNLSPTQKSALDNNPGGALDSLGTERVAWLRGSETAHPSFRSRSESGQPRLLGDIVNSNPKFQAGVLYVGANDGMMHAFDAETGDELFAYIPSSLLEPEGSNPFAPLSRLMDPGYTHRYFVDGTVSVIDLSTAGVPKKILVGGLGAGGRTVFALDVTNPASFSPANVMWEFTHPELGYNVGQPAIVHMSNGQLAAVFGNGYNSNNHRAQLFVVNLDTGALIQVIDTGVGNAASPNGLAAPVVTDWPLSNLKANRVYAGDLQGNLWRFDVGGPPTTWNDAGKVTSMFQAIGPGGNVQPITGQPVMALNPVDNSEVIVAFGTGSYFRLQDSDMPGAPTQTLYGIFDTATGVSGVIRDDLLQQTITLQDLEGFGAETVTVRVVSDNVLDPATDKGWYLDLPDDGERVVTEATFPTGPMQRRVRFTTLIPDEDPCGSGRRGFLMDIDLLSGGRTPYSVFDLNRDGSYDFDDMVGGLPVSGVAWGQGEKPTVLTPINSGGDPEEFIYTGEGIFIKGLGEEGIGGRQSWQQLR